VAIKSHRSTGALALFHRELEAVLQKSPVTIAQFQQILSHVDTGIKTAYQTANLSAEDRSGLEKDMLIQGSIPALLTPAVKDLLTATITSLKSEINIAELYLTDTSALGLTADDNGKRWRRDHPMDAMRKVELRREGGTPIKRCAKCGNVTEDVQVGRGSNMAVVGLQRHCLCGGWWMVGDEEEGVVGF